MHKTIFCVNVSFASKILMLQHGCKFAAATENMWESEEVVLHHEPTHTKIVAMQWPILKILSGTVLYLS
jgi:hypothetical protein